MRLLGMLLIIAWYTVAKQMSNANNRNAAGWQVRCLNCQTTRTATESEILRVSGRATKKYSLAQCAKCSRTVGMAIEQEAIPAEVVA